MSPATPFDMSAVLRCGWQKVSSSDVGKTQPLDSPRTPSLKPRRDHKTKRQSKTLPQTPPREPKVEVRSAFGILSDAVAQEPWNDAPFSGAMVPSIRTSSSISSFAELKANSMTLLDMLNRGPSEDLIEELEEDDKSPPKTSTSSPLIGRRPSVIVLRDGSAPSTTRSWWARTPTRSNFNEMFGWSSKLASRRGSRVISTQPSTAASEGPNTPLTPKLPAKFATAAYGLVDFPANPSPSPSRASLLSFKSLRHRRGSTTKSLAAPIFSRKSANCWDPEDERNPLEEHAEKPADKPEINTQSHPSNEPRELMTSSSEDGSPRTPTAENSARLVLQLPENRCSMATEFSDEMVDVLSKASHLGDPTHDAKNWRASRARDDGTSDLPLRQNVRPHLASFSAHEKTRRAPPALPTLQRRTIGISLLPGSSYSTDSATARAAPDSPACEEGLTMDLLTSIGLKSHGPGDVDAAARLTSTMGTPAKADNRLSVHSNPEVGHIRSTPSSPSCAGIPPTFPKSATTAAFPADPRDSLTITRRPRKRTSCPPSSLPAPKTPLPALPPSAWVNVQTPRRVHFQAVAP